MKKPFLIFFIVIAIFSSSYPRDDSDMPLFSQSVATVNDVSAGLINPAGLVPTNVMGLRYIHSFPDSSYKGDNGFILTTKGSLVSIQWLKHGNGIFRRKYLLASGRKLFSNFYWGLSYAWFGGSNEIYHNKKVWKIGLLYRPRPTISLGLVIDDLNRPKFSDRLERHYTLGVGFGPLKRRLTLSMDAYFIEKDNLDKAEAMFRVEVKASSRIKLVADYRTEGFFRMGLAMSMNHIEIGAGLRFFSNEYMGGNLYYNQGPSGRAR